MRPGFLPGHCIALVVLHAASHKNVSSMSTTSLCDLPACTIDVLLRHPRVLRLSWRPGMAKIRMLRLLQMAGQRKMWVEYVTASTATDVLEKEHPDLWGRQRVAQQDVSEYLKEPLRICEDATLWLVFSAQADCGGWMSRNAALKKYDLPDLRRGTSLWGSKTHGLLINCVLCKPEHAAHHLMAKEMAVECDDGATFCVVGEYLECGPVSLGALPREMSQYLSLPLSKMNDSDPRYRAMVTVLNQHSAAYLPAQPAMEDTRRLDAMMQQLDSANQG